MPLEELWNDYHSELLNFIRQRVNCPQDAEDILQDVFIKAHQHDCPGKDNPRAWLYQTTRTTIIDYYRTQKSYSPLPDTIIADEPVNDRAVEVVAGCLRSEVESLPAHYRDVLLAVDFEGKTQQEVSEAVDVPYPTVRSRVQRARQQLRNTVEQCCRVFFDHQQEAWQCEAKQPCAC
jgi:RNA polymerase sigma-70 factor (ECF subfamily)